jgi:pyruvate,water dikinase
MVVETAPMGTLGAVAEHAASWSVAREIVWLGEPDAEARAFVGGKVAPLSRLAAQYRVPPGFCLTTLAHAAALASGGAHTADTAPALPARLREHIASAYARLAALTGLDQPAVAVRSSAVDEDGDGTSFAGQHDTYLNVVGVDAICDAVVRCWASALAPRALDYRRQHGLSTTQPQIAVLVQHLVVADASGVAFSANPMTGRRDEVVVNVSWGLGESVVGGSVTPDSYVLRAPGRPAAVAGAWTVAERATAQKRRMTVAVVGGTREVDVPRMLQATPALEDDRLFELARLAHDLEQTMGWPIDLECAFRDDVLYLLQCRPITTLAAVTA